MPTLNDHIGSPVHKPLCIVRINGTEIYNPIAVDVTVGVEQQSSTATVRLAAEDYPSWAIGSVLSISLGYQGVGGGVRDVFKGEIEDIDTQFMPYFVALKAAGFLKRAQRNAGNTDPLSPVVDLDTGQPVPVLTWENKTDSEIWISLMQLAGVPSYIAGDGDSRTITGPLYLNAGDNIRSRIDDLDHASESGQRTFEFSGRVYRRAMLRIPGGVASWRYTEGEPDPDDTPQPLWGMYSLQRQQTDRDVKNQAIIQGQKAAGTESTDTVGAVQQEYSTYWGKDGFGNDIYVPFSLTSEFLETRDQCQAVAERYMYENNKVTDVLTMRTPLNPYAIPTLTVGIISPKLNLWDETNYWIRQVSHHWGPDGATTDWELEGGAGSTGYLVGLPPIPDFEMAITKEAIQSGIYDTPTVFYTVACDASKSRDPDGTALTYAWEASNGDTGTGVTFTTTFTEAQWADTDNPPTITLVVTDSDSPTPHSATTGPVPAANTGTTTNQQTASSTIAMYVAALGKAYATPDGWSTVHEWTPPASCISVGRIGAQGTNYFGLNSGAVYKTTDYLASTPTLVWTAPAAVNAIWMSELDSNTIALGLQNGDFYITKDAFATAPVLKRSFVNPIEWINGSNQVKTQWRVLVGQDVWYTNNDFLSTFLDLVIFLGLTAVQSELTPWANYASARGNAGDVILKREGDGYPYTFPSLTPAPAEVHMTNFIDRDSLLVGDDQGRSFLGTSDASAALVQKTNIGYGAVHDMLRDNTNFKAAYAACNTALAKTFDAAETWHRVITMNGTTVRGLRIGYDSAVLVPPLPPIPFVIETTTTSKSTHFSKPASWDLITFDDSSYPNAVEQTCIGGDPLYADNDYGNYPVCGAVRSGFSVGVYLRDKFTLPAGKVTTAAIELRAHHDIIYLRINNQRVLNREGSPGWATPGNDMTTYTASVDPALLIPGGDNVITMGVVSAHNPPDTIVSHDYEVGGYYKLTLT